LGDKHSPLKLGLRPGWYLAEEEEKEDDDNNSNSKQRQKLKEIRENQLRICRPSLTR
jgi:hypothetical protein